MVPTNRLQCKRDSNSRQPQASNSEEIARALGSVAVIPSDMIDFFKVITQCNCTVV